MSGNAKAATLAIKKVEDDLLWVLRTTEHAVDGLVKGFHALTAHSESIVKHAASIADCVEGNQVASVLSQVRVLGTVAKQYVAERLHATTKILDTVTGEVELLRQLEKVTDDQGKIAIQIKILNIYTKIEVAHLGKVGKEFDYLAGELADFSQSLAQNTDQLSRHTKERKISIENTRQMLVSKLPELREELSRVDQSLSEDLRVLNTGLASLAQTPSLFRSSAEDISRQIEGVIVAVQGHDITRQQIEHVREGAGIVRDLLVDKEAMTDKSGSTGQAHVGLAIQISQLKAIKETIKGWTSQIALCMESILNISASDLANIGPLVREQERSLAVQLSHIEVLEGECESYGGKIHGTLEGITNLSHLVTEHLQKSEAAQNKLQRLTYNSIVEASRLGSKADTICVIADGIAEVSVEWRLITEQSSRALNDILQLSGKINDVMSTFSHSNSERLKEAQQITKNGLDGLRHAAAFSVDQGQKIGSIADLMRAKSDEVRTLAVQLGACFDRIDASLVELEGLKEGMLLDNPLLGDQYDRALVEALYAASYTTQAERDVLRATIYGAQAVQTMQSFEGNCVELF